MSKRRSNFNAWPMKPDHQHDKLGATWKIGYFNWLSVRKNSYAFHGDRRVFLRPVKKHCRVTFMCHPAVSYHEAISSCKLLFV